MREWLEYSFVWVLLKCLGALPRPLARAVGACMAVVFAWFLPQFQRAAMFNLRLAFPEWTEARRRRTFRGLVRQLGWMAAEFSRFPKYNRQNIERVVILDGFENFAAGRQRGKGVLFLTGHTSAWEVMPFAHALYDRPIHFLVRPLDNARVDALVNLYRGLSGNRPIEKNQSVRGILEVVRKGGSVGILADVNTSLEEGVFVDFFGIPACTTTGIARLALRTDAAVVPGFLYWDEAMRNYRLQFEPPMELVRTGDLDADIRENTARFMKAIEQYVRRHPEQWLWVHKRWKTRPPGEKPLYPF